MSIPATQIRISLTTTHDDLQLPDHKRQLYVPADIKRYGLSRVLNSSSMLDMAHAVPLDFLVDGAFLRGSLADHLAANGLSAETTVTLRYVRSLLPPVFEASFPHDDWVSSVDVLSATTGTSRRGDGGGDRDDDDGDDNNLHHHHHHHNHDNDSRRILSASYDGLVRMWDESGNCVATSPGARAGGHARRLNAARFLSGSSLVSAGLDQKIVVWDYSEDGANGRGGAQFSTGTPLLRPTMELHGHAKMVTSLDVNGPARRILSACADGTVGLWSASRRTAPAADPATLPSATRAPKRTKLSTASSAHASAPQRGPLLLIPAHADAATAAIFHPTDTTVAYSVSHDHSLRTLDLTTARCVSTLTTLHPLLCAAALTGSPLVAAGSAARHVVLLDPRDGAGAGAAATAMTLRGHLNMVVGVAPAPDCDHALVSASHDGTCRIWDLRSTRSSTAIELGSGGNSSGGGGNGNSGGGRVVDPVYSIGRGTTNADSINGNGRKVVAATAAGTGVKVLAVAWDKEWGIVSGGEDRTVQINRGRDLVAS